MLANKFCGIITGGCKTVTAIGRLSNAVCKDNVVGGNFNNAFSPSVIFNIGAKRFYPQLPKRFYQEVTVTKNPGNDTYEINLDQRKLKTPGKHTFQVKSEGLAMAICQEWASQDQFIQQSFMHLTSLANTVLDNPQHKTKFDLVNQCLSYVPEDTILFRVPETNNKLLELQNEKWDPVIQWFESEFETRIPIVYGSIFPPEISESELANLRSFLSTYSFESLQGLIFAMGTLRSVILIMAVAKQKLSVREAVELCRLETTFQTDHWGNVEWAHDLELQETLARTSAGILFHNFHVTNDNDKRQRSESLS